MVINYRYTTCTTNLERALFLIDQYAENRLGNDIRIDIGNYYSVSTTKQDIQKSTIKSLKKVVKLAFKDFKNISIGITTKD